MWSRLTVGSVRNQIIALAVLPILLGLFMDGIFDWILDEGERISPEASAAARIELLVDQARAAGTPEELDTLLTVTTRAGLPVESVPLAELAGREVRNLSRTDPRVLVKAALPPTMNAVALGETATGRLRNVLVVGDAGEGRALAFALPDPRPGRFPVTGHQVGLVLQILVVLASVLLLSLYNGHMISALVQRFAAAAKTLKPEIEEDQPFPETGGRELRSLARALNEMQGRIRGLVEDRTRMLRAISHDLRTPLTRLRLRVDRSTDRAFREDALGDITLLNDMIAEAMGYLSNDAMVEETRVADLSSLLQTVRDNFTDMGFGVTFEGPPRLRHACKPRALNRAISNLVENATKFGGEISLGLSRAEDGGVRIEVADDGPGIPPDLHGKVMEPFYKVDSARSASGLGGFGLGLSIVDSIIRGHEGKFELANRDPQGFVARIWLPPSRET